MTQTIPGDEKTPAKYTGTDPDDSPPLKTDDKEKVADKERREPIPEIVDDNTGRVPTGAD